MKTNLKPIIMSVATLATLGGATVLSATAVNAQSNGSTLVERIASKFNLSESDVQAVVDEIHEEKQVERQAEMSENLQDKVESGDITSEQKTLIETKQKEIQLERENEQNSLQKWADENNIDPKYLMQGRGRMGVNDKRLDNAVESGNLTEEQRSLIETKQKEIQDLREAHHDEMEQWAKDNNIDLEDIMPMGGPRGGHMGRM